MDINLSFWNSPEGASLLHSAKEKLSLSNNDTLRAGTLLRKQFSALPPERIAAALECILLREKAALFGEWTQRGFFTKQSLEQASTPRIAEHHATCFRGRKHLVEICTGLGFDTAALARVVGRITTIEADAELAALARHNLAAQGIHNVEVIEGRAEDILPNMGASSIDALWSDPSRRNPHGCRIENPDEYLPSLAFVQKYVENHVEKYVENHVENHVENRVEKYVENCVGNGVNNLQLPFYAGIKIAPAANLTALHLQGWKREWIGAGVGGGQSAECREQTLWWGLQDDVLVDGRVSLPEIGAMWQPSAGAASRAFQECSPTSLQDLNDWYCCEPHPCLIRSGYLAEFFRERGIAMLDKHIAYGISPQKPEASLWYQTFRILEAFSFHRARLKERVLARGWGKSVEIKKRGFPETPDEIRKWLKLPQQGTGGVVIIARIGAGASNEHLVMLAERLR